MYSLRRPLSSKNRQTLPVPGHDLTLHLVYNYLITKALLASDDAVNRFFSLRSGSTGRNR